MLNFYNINEQKIEEEITKINIYIDMQISKKKNLLQFLNNINNSVQDMSDLDQLNSSVLLLKNIKICLDAIRNIISSLENLKELLSNFKQNQYLINDIEKYNNLLSDSQKDMYKNELKIQDLICKYIESSIFIPNKDANNNVTIKENEENNTKSTSSIEIEENTPKVEEKLDEEKKEEQKLNSSQEEAEPINSNLDITKDTNSPTSQENEISSSSSQTEDLADTDSKLSDNHVLLISEKQNKVFLPYEIKDLEKKLNESKKYKTIQEIINKEYVIPYEKYKSPIISRFREAYSLMKNKEKASIFDSLDLALELSFNSLLNPAVISACKNLTELDIYLDYLDTNELDKFKCFEIKYEILPQKK